MSSGSIRNGPYGSAVLARPHILQYYKDGYMLVMGLINGSLGSDTDHAVIQVIDTREKTISTLCINSGSVKISSISSCAELGCDSCWFEVGKLPEAYVSQTEATLGFV